MKYLSRLKIRVQNFVIRHKYLSMAIALLLIWFLAAFLLMVIERFGGASSSSYQSFQKSLWAIIVYLTSGLEVAPPETVVGRAFAIFVLLTGILVISVITASVTSDLVDRMIRGASVPEKPRNLKLENHIVIFGYSDSTEKIIQELHHPDVGVETPIVIVTREEKQIPLGDPEIYREVYSVYGSYTDKETLQRADITTAETAIILREVSDRDAILTCLGVEKTNPEVHTVIQLSEKENVSHVRKAGGKEVVRLASMNLIANAVISPGISEVFEELLTAQSDQNELYFLDLPREHTGKTYREVSSVLMENQLLPVGIVYAGQGKNMIQSYEERPEASNVNINPDPEYVLEKENGLAVIAKEEPQLT